MPPVITVLVLAYVVRFLFAPVETVKWIGAPFMLLPSALGVLPSIREGDVHAVDLSISSPILTIERAGIYAVYAADNVMLARANVYVDRKSSWISAVNVDTGVTTAGAIVTRGATIYDPIAVPGRPVLTLALPNAGRYKLDFPRQTGRVYFAPDPIDGRERLVIGSIVAQIMMGLLIVVLCRRQQIVESHFARKHRAEEMRRKRVESAKFVRDWNNHMG